jgi:hypothetical protein
VRRRELRAFAGEVVGVDLRLRPGAKRRKLDAEGNTLSVVFDERAQLRLNIGDQLVVCAADLDQDAIACAVVDHIGQDGTPTLRAVCGELPRGPVHVLPARKARAARAAPRRQAVERPGAPIAARAAQVRAAATRRPAP